MKRSTGILLHPTSLPGPEGIGTLGRGAYAWVDRLAETGVRWWQMLPLGPTGFGDSPYQCYSAFAGNPLLIDLERLGETPPPASEESAVDFETLRPKKFDALLRAFSRFTPDTAFETFCEAQAFWLDDYALFMALKRHFGGQTWTRWPEPIRRREPEAVARYRAALRDDITFERFVQFRFFSQFAELKAYAEAKHVHFIGDLPIYVAADSADVWSRPHLFRLDADLEPLEVAGVPPDAFSETGQRWGNPLYDWKAMRRDGYAWWIARMRASLAMFARVRIDHFRGFEAYWAIPAGEATAENGRWEPGPGTELFDALETALGKHLPFIAEDLGIITPEVEALRDAYGLPGMKILQFAFGGDASNPYLPHNHVRNSVVYTGTHDNDTTNGWFYALSPDAPEVVHAMRYLDCGWDAFHTRLNRAALVSVADLAVLPMQDVLGLGSDARMNVPGTAEGNWRWRLTRAQFENAPWDALHDLIVLYGR